MLHQFVEHKHFLAFQDAVKEGAAKTLPSGKTLSLGAACLALRVPLERLHALIEENRLDAWAYFPEPGTNASHFFVSTASVVAYGLARGLFPMAEKAQFLVTAEEYETLRRHSEIQNA